MMWDLGFAIGHATRSVADCLGRAREDMTIRTSVLESRHVWGDETLYGDFRRRFLSELVPGTEAEFVAAKLRERDERHLRAGDSRYLLEPNVKDGKGGLRDLHALFWIAKYLYRVGPLRRPRRARRAEPERRMPASRGRRASSGGSAPTSTPSAAGQRTASPSTASRRSRRAWATGRAAAISPSSAS